jgi:hypothetical protein
MLQFIYFQYPSTVTVMYFQYAAHHVQLLYRKRIEQRIWAQGFVTSMAGVATTWLAYVTDAARTRYLQ